MGASRGLSFEQAQSCEQAQTARCRCRCGGEFHGAARVVDVLRLPAEDPHAVSKRIARRELRRRRREAADQLELGEVSA